MPKVFVPLINNKHGLHKGHQAIIKFAKKYGDVHITLSENTKDRNHYLETGKGTPKYKINASKIQEDCEKLNVKIIFPDYIKVSEERRTLVYNRATSFINICRDYLISENYIRNAIGALASSLLVTPGIERQFDFIVYGPEPLAFFFRRVALLSGMHGERPIYKQIIKDKDGIKIGISWRDVPFSKKRAREVIDTTRSRYKIGDNAELVQEINHSLLNTEDWKVSQIIVYEGGFVDGRIEDVSFSYSTNPGTAIVNNIDYFE